MYQVLTFISYGEAEGEKYEITLSPHAVRMLTAMDCLRNGIALKKVLVDFFDEGSAELYITSMDLRDLQTAIGAYCLD